jgi:hypothetical protein
MKTIALLTAFALSTGGVIPSQAVGDWSRVMRLKAGATIRVHTRDGVVKQSKVRLVQNDRLVVGNKDVITEIPKAAITEIQTEPRRSIIGGALGGLAGLIAGLYSAVYLGLKQCGGSCSDEGGMIIGALVGMPIGGAYVGSTIFRSDDWNTVYRSR